jgi:hypothetical protein
LGLSIGHKLSYYQGYYWIPCYTHIHIYILYIYIRYIYIYNIYIYTL